ncbi:hypothetical protein GCM10010840_16410 [Deinococcus aerolatus]|uniref:Prepilin-type N-terminal cleavage/methylation domain-containing protein n=1 Tax=Deinococcus aerolatus TaxID=522487 RepID=A0ABQ2G7X3_9DEIO|nr:prepilin-type N-terminal cleavage/methylation domain-containing protein [Deinococcus aerolatus]GGL79266.1 hypothetical protein GCM10010840_16410 [Deinococcus aerolatus]
MKGRAESGLTLVEVMVAVGIFAVLIGAILPIISDLFRVNRDTVNVQTIGSYAQSVGEQTRTLWLTRVTPVAPSTDAYPSFTAGQVPNPLPSPPANVSCAAPLVEAVGSASPVGRRRLTVTCTPPGKPAMVFVIEIGRPE